MKLGKKISTSTWLWNQIHIKHSPNSRENEPKAPKIAIRVYTLFTFTIVKSLWIQWWWKELDMEGCCTIRCKSVCSALCKHHFAGICSSQNSIWLRSPLFLKARSAK